MIAPQTRTERIGCAAATRRTRLVVRRLVLLVLTLIPSIASAEPVTQDRVVIDTFGPGDTYDIGGLDRLWMPIAPSPFLLGMAFTPDVDVRLSSVEIAATSLLSGIRDVHAIIPGQSPPASALVVAVRSGVNGVPGEALEQFNYSNLPLYDQRNSVFFAASKQRPMLHAGATYWLTTSDVDGWAIWNVNSIGFRGTIALTEYDDPCCALFSGVETGAFRITGTASPQPIPEPTSAVLLGTGMLVAAGVRRWRRRQQ